MKSIFMWIFCIMILSIITTCRKEPEHDSIWTYDWLETRIYDPVTDSITSIKPNNEDEIFHIVNYTGVINEEANWVKFYRGNTLLSECIVSESYVSSEYDFCFGAGTYCWKLDDDFDLCYDIYTYDTAVFFQFPFLEGENLGCNSGSFFKITYEKLD